MNICHENSYKFSLIVLSLVKERVSMSKILHYPRGPRKFFQFCQGSKVRIEQLMPKYSSNNPLLGEYAVLKSRVGQEKTCIIELYLEQTIILSRDHIYEANRISKHGASLELQPINMTERNSGSPRRD